MVLRDPQPLPPNVDVRNQKSWWMRDDLPPNVNIKRAAVLPSTPVESEPITTNGGAPPAPGTGDTTVEPQPIEEVILPPPVVEEERPANGDDSGPPAETEPESDKGPFGFGILPGVRGRIAGLRGDKKSHLGGNEWKSVD